MMEFNAVQVLDRFSLVTPLGIRFWDGVTNSVIADDSLRVTTYPEVNANLKTQGFSNSQGVYIFRNLPGLRVIENGGGENSATFWSNPPVQLPYVIEGKDNAQRFLPFQISLTLPQHGLFALPCVNVGTPPTPTTLVPLFSAPARAVPGGLAVLHAELWDFNTKNAAAWVIMDVRVPGKTPFQGMSDGQGRITIFFPYPEPTDFAPDSAFDPPANPPNPPPPQQLQGSPLADHQWTLDIHAYYKPPAQLPTLPDLCPTLTQAEATLLADIANKKTLTQVTLKYGQELVLRYQPSVLWITPAA